MLFTHRFRQLQQHRFFNRRTAVLLVLILVALFVLLGQIGKVLNARAKSFANNSATDSVTVNVATLSDLTTTAPPDIRDLKLVVAPMTVAPLSGRITSPPRAVDILSSAFHYVSNPSAGEPIVPSDAV